MLSHLESALQVGQVHQMASSLEDFMFSLRKERAEGLNSFVTRYRNSRSRLRGLGIELPGLVEGFLYLRKLNLGADQRQTILSLAGGSYKLEDLIRASQTLLQDVASQHGPSSSQGAASSATMRPRDRHQGNQRRSGYSHRFRKRQFVTDAEDRGSDQDSSSEELVSDESPEDDSQETSPTDEDVEGEFQAFLAFKQARALQKDVRKNRGFRPSSRGQSVHRRSERSDRETRGEPRRSSSGFQA